MAVPPLAPSSSSARALRWHVWCRVIDNHGDLGVCWRLAADLARRGDTVTLWVDDPAALAWMAPGGQAGVEVRPWRGDAPAGLHDAPLGDAVVEAFGCDPPAAFVARMAAAGAHAPVWLNLEYLSAERYVERCHGLMSPQLVGPGAGLVKHFWYPGFTARTGGLLREPGLLQARDAFDPAAWRAAHGIVPADGERCVSLFGYPGAPIDPLLAALADRPTLVLLCPGAGHEAAGRPHPPGLRLQALPYLPQPDYDRLLWSCELNLVRGEDSAVRALWAGRPSLWQLYPQHDGAQAAKLEAFLDTWLDADAASAPLAGTLRRLYRAWNGLAPWPAPPGHEAQAWPDAGAWAAAARRLAERLATGPDLADGLRRAVRRLGHAVAADTPALHPTDPGVG